MNLNGQAREDSYSHSFCGPQNFLLFEFGPRAKKSGHPWYRICSKIEGAKSIEKL